MSTANGSTEVATETKTIVSRTPTPLVPSTLGEAWELARWLAQGTLIPEHYRGQPANILAAIYMGNDLGISPMQAMREIYVVHGRPASGALLKIALVKQSPHCKYFRMVPTETTDSKATFETWRVGEPEPVRHTYTIEDAKLAGLYPGKGDSNWAKRPKLMLRRRCESELADEIYPDVVKGLRTEDEAMEIQGEVIRRESAQPPATVAPPPPLAASNGPVNVPVVQPPAAVAAQPADKAEPPTTATESAPAITPSSDGAPDPVDVYLSELSQIDPRSLDEMIQQANLLVPKGHPRRDEVRRAVEAARARAKGT